MSTLSSTFDTASKAAGDAVADVESAEASLNSRFLKAQADITNKINGADALNAQLNVQVSTSESRVVSAVVAGNTANAMINEQAALGTTLSSMVKNNDQNVVVAVSNTLSTHQKTVDRAKVRAQ